MYCKVCGNYVPVNTDTCPGCGTKMSLDGGVAGGAQQYPGQASDPYQGAYQTNQNQAYYQNPADNQGYYQNNQYSGYPGQPGSEPGKGAAIASMVLGIITLVFCWMSFFAIIGIITGAVGIILAMTSKKAGYMGGMRTAGFVCSVVGLAISSVVFLCCAIVCAAASSYSSYRWWY